MRVLVRETGKENIKSWRSWRLYIRRTWKRVRECGKAMRFWPIIIRYPWGLCYNFPPIISLIH